MMVIADTSRAVRTDQLPAQRGNPAPTYSCDGALRALPVLWVIPNPRIELREFLSVRPRQGTDMGHLGAL